MNTLDKCKLDSPRKMNHIASQEKENCTICQLMRIRQEQADLVDWLLNSDDSFSDKEMITSLLTGIKFDKEVFEYLDDPTIREFIMSK